MPASIILEAWAPAAASPHWLFCFHVYSLTFYTAARMILLKLKSDRVTSLLRTFPLLALQPLPLDVSMIHFHVPPFYTFSDILPKTIVPSVPTLYSFTAVSSLTLVSNIKLSDLMLSMYLFINRGTEAP